MSFIETLHGPQGKNVALFWQVLLYLLQGIKYYHIYSWVISTSHKVVKMPVSQERQYGYESSEKPQTQTSLKTNPLNWSTPQNCLLLCYSIIGLASRNRQQCHLLAPLGCHLLYENYLTLSLTIFKKGVSFSFLKLIIFHCIVLLHSHWTSHFWDNLQNFAPLWNRKS